MTAATPPEHPLRRHLVWVLVSLAYLSVAPYFPRINNPNENVRVWMTRAIVEDHTLAIDGAVHAWGYVDDKAVSGAHLYSSKAPGTSLLGVPVLWLQTRVWHAAGWPSPSKAAATFALRFFSVMPCALLFLYWFARWVERRTGAAAARDLLVVGLGLGSMLYPYGVVFVGHAQGAMAAFAAFMVLTWDDADRGPSSRRRLAMAGALAGAAVLFEYQLLLVALVLGGFALWRYRTAARWFVLGALPLAVALGAYHTALFGRPWTFPYGHLENATYARIDHSSGFFGLSRPHLNALAPSLFSISYGLFAFSPFLLLGLGGAGFRAWRRPRAEAVVCLLVGLLLVLFLAGMTHWRAGWCVGPRYIAGVAPFLAAGVALTWRDVAASARAGAARLALGALVVVAVFLNGLSAATYPHYPEVFDNPVFDLTLPLWRDGYVPSGLGHALGLPGAWALLPVAALWAVALGVALGAGGGRRAVVRVGGPALLGLLLLGALARYGRAPSIAETHATAVVRALWDPTPAGMRGAAPALTAPTRATARALRPSVLAPSAPRPGG